MGKVYKLVLKVAKKLKIGYKMDILGIV